MIKPKSFYSILTTLVFMLVLNSDLQALQAGDKAPEVVLPFLLGGGKLSLSDLKGRVVYVDFWASWCGPCRKSFPALDQLRAELSAQGFEVYAINLDEKVADTEAFLKKFPVKFPLLHDAAGKTAEQFGVMGMPTAYLLDQQGVIRKVHQGFKNKDIAKIRSEVLSLLKTPRK